MTMTPQTKENTAHFFTRIEVVFLIVVLLMVGIISAIGCFVCSSKSTVTFDLKGTTALFLKQAKHASLEDERRQDLAKAFAQAMEGVVQRYAKEHHAIVLVKGAVVAGAMDATQDIQRLIARQMRSMSQKDSQKSDSKKHKKSGVGHA